LTEHGLPGVQDAADHWGGIVGQIIHGDPNTLPQTVEELGKGADPALYSRIAQGLVSGLVRDDTRAGRGNLSPAATEVAYLRGGWQQTPAQTAAQSGDPSTSPPATYNTNGQAAARDMGTPATPQIAQPAQPAATPQLATYNINDQAAGVRDINVKGVAEIAVRLLDSLGRTVGIEHISVPLANSDQQGKAYVPGRPGSY